MIASISYALVLFLHPGQEPKVFANFPTAAACRIEREAVLQDLKGTKITAACVPQERMEFDNMEHIMNRMRGIQQRMESEGKF